MTRKINIISIIRYTNIKFGIQSEYHHTEKIYFRHCVVGVNLRLAYVLLSEINDYIILLLNGIVCKLAKDFYLNLNLSSRSVSTQCISAIGATQLEVLIRKSNKTHKSFGLVFEFSLK